MNDTRRKELKVLLDQAEELKEKIEAVRDEEQEYYDNMPDAFQQGEKGDKAQETIDQLDNAVNSLDEVMEALDEASQ